MVIIFSKLLDMDHCIVTELKENRVMSIVGIETNLVHVEAP